MVSTDPQHVPEVPRAQVGQRILKATGALMIIQVIMRCFGIIEKMIMSHYFGTGPEANAYSAARRIAAPVLQLGEQVIMHSFLPAFVLRLREKGEGDAWRLASTVINLLILLMAAVAVVGILFTRGLMNLFLHDWLVHQPELVPLTLKLTQVMVVAMIFLAVSSLTYCLLNSYKQFALPASSDIALKGAVLVFAMLFAKHWGAYALAVGFVVGAIAKVAVQSAGLGKRLANYRPVVDLKHPGLKQFAWLVLPLVLGWAFSTFRGWVETRMLATVSDPAGFSALDYAKVLTDIPVTFFPYAFGIALFPFLADIAAAGDTDRLRSMLLSATRMMVLIFVPLAAAMIVLRFPILLGLYASDKFTMASAVITAVPLTVYAVAMLACALEIIVNQFFFAQADTVRPTVVGMVLMPLHLAVLWVGFKMLGWGAVTVALAMLIYRSGKVIALYTMIRRKVGALGGPAFLLFCGKVLLALIPFVLLLLGGMRLLPGPDLLHDLCKQFIKTASHHYLHGGVADKLARLLSLVPHGLLAFIGVPLYLALLHLLKVDEIAMLLSKVRGKLGKGKAAAEAR
jgi:putative peptidoglycan lipid II flippase